MSYIDEQTLIVGLKPVEPTSVFRDRCGFNGVWMCCRHRVCVQIDKVSSAEFLEKLQRLIPGGSRLVGCMERRMNSSQDGGSANYISLIKFSQRIRWRNVFKSLQVCRYATLVSYAM
jgi:hypothetical protein